MRRLIGLLLLAATPRRRANRAAGTRPRRVAAPADPAIVDAGGRVARR